MWLTKIALSAVVLVAVAALNLEEPLEKDEIIEAVNSGKTTWTVSTVSIIYKHIIIIGNHHKFSRKYCSVICKMLWIYSIFQAGRNFHPLATKKYIKSLLGWKKDVNRKPLPKYEPDYEFVDLPATFDSRKQWSFCKALQTVRDQGDCGSCWVSHLQGRIQEEIYDAKTNPAGESWIKLDNAGHVRHMTPLKGFLFSSRLWIFQFLTSDLWFH